MRHRHVAAEALRRRNQITPTSHAKFTLIELVDFLLQERLLSSHLSALYCALEITPPNRLGFTHDIFQDCKTSIASNELGEVICGDRIFVLQPVLNHAITGASSRPYLAEGLEAFPPTEAKHGLHD